MDGLATKNPPTNRNLVPFRGGHPRPVHAEHVHAGVHEVFGEVAHVPEHLPPGGVGQVGVELLQVVHGDVLLGRLQQHLVLGPQGGGGHQPGQAGVGPLLDL